MALGISRGHHNLFETYVDVRMLEIQCAICNKTVDKVVREKQHYADKFTYTVHCHGDTDTCELTRYEIENSSGRIEPGYAFGDQRLNADRARLEMPGVHEGSCEEIRPNTLLLPEKDGED